MARGLGANFNKLWSAAAISNLGDGVIGAALPLLVASITRDPFLVAMGTVVARLPWFLFALFAGAVVDRLDRKVVMVSADLFRGAVLAALGLMLYVGDVSLALIYVVGFLIGTAETLFDTAWEALLPRLVTEEDLERANGRLQATEWSANSFIGPPLGSLLFVVAVGLPFVLDAATFIAAALLVALIPGSYRSDRIVDSGRGAIRRDIGEGLKWLWGHTVLRTLSLMAGVTNFIGTAVAAIFVLYVQDILDLGDAAFGVLLATLGVGGLAGALTASLVSKRLGPGTTLLLNVFAMAPLSMAFVLTTNLFVIVPILVAFGALIGAWNVVAISLRQSLTPDELRGRVASVARLLAWGTQPLGALGGGVVAGVLGLRAPFVFAAVTWLVVGFLVAPVINNRRIAQLKAEA